MKELGIGIIGSGRMGERHAEAYLKVANAKLIGFFDVDKKRAQTLAKKYSVEAFPDIESLTKDKRIDAVNVCTPNANHVDPTLLAAEAGKHILVEKPLATTIEDCDTIIRRTKKAGVTAMVGQTHRFYPSNVAAKKLIETGCIGSVRMIQDYYLDPGFLEGGGAPAWIKSKESSGIITDAVHFVDRIRWWSGRDIEAIETFSLDRIRQESDIEEIAMVAFKLTSRISASLMVVSPSWGVRDNQTRIIGTDGAIYVKYGEEVKVGRQQWEVHDFPFRTSPPSYEHNLAGFKAELEEFVASIIHDRVPSVTLEDGRKAVQAVLAIQESHSSGTRVRV